MCSVRAVCDFYRNWNAIMLIAGVAAYTDVVVATNLMPLLAVIIIIFIILMCMLCVELAAYRRFVNHLIC